MLVVENGSSEVSEADVSPARLLRLPQPGRSQARNAGVEAASNQLVGFLDADDVSLPGRLERQRRALAGDPGAVLAFGSVRVVDGAGRPLDGWNSLLARRFERLAAAGAGFEAILETRCPIYTSAVMVRRAAFLEAGGYDPRFEAYEDLDLYLRLSRRGRLLPLAGEPVTVYRLHGENTASDRLYEGSLGVADKHLPDSRGAARRLLLERRVDALWGLGRFAEARRAAVAAARDEPRLLTRPFFARRLAGSLLPERLLRARR